MADLWRRRPPNARTGKRYTAKRSRQQLAELLRFLRWLHLDDACDWREPADLPRLPRTIDADTPAERAAAGTGLVATMPAAAWGPIVRHGDALDRAVTLLGLNTAGGAAEVGRLTWGNVRPPGPHPWAAEGLAVPDAPHGWVLAVRGKSGVAASWPLWRETAGVLAAWRDVAAERLGRVPRPDDRVLLLADGSPLYRDGAGPGGKPSKNAQARTAARWVKVLARCGRAGSPVPAVPFGDSHRNAFPGWATTAGVAAEVVDTAMAHGTPHPEGPLLFKHYASRPWGRAFAAVAAWGEVLAPTLAPALATTPHGG